MSEERTLPQIIADGYPAVVRRQGGNALVYAGPFREKHTEVLADLRRRYGANKLFWVQVPGGE